MITRVIPSTNEKLPVIGMGTWQTFDVNESLYPALANVLTIFRAEGGSLIDSSPMYGKSESVVGKITSEPDFGNDFFFATKVWTTGEKEGIVQMKRSMKLLNRVQVDLMQIHNLTDWRTHLKTLRQWKEQGKIRYIGLTHYTNASHDTLEKIMRQEKIDFVQFNYSILSRNAEARLLAAAGDCGVATLINRPLGEGQLFSKVRGKPLPDFAVQNGITSWGSYFLRYVISHSAVTCVIPATSNVNHLIDNLEAGKGSLPDLKLRKRMLEYLESL